MVIELLLSFFRLTKFTSISFSNREHFSTLFLFILSAYFTIPNILLFDHTTLPAKHICTVLITICNFIIFGTIFFCFYFLDYIKCLSSGSFIGIHKYIFFVYSYYTFNFLLCLVEGVEIVFFFFLSGARKKKLYL